ncbi:MAG TPA: sensor histidine kinase [Verrucomicrobiae bacterium]|nr:sensor histidine kinase [Verrucomicrobiae bacterium]
MKLNGVVLYADPVRGDLIIHDNSGGIYVGGWLKYLADATNHSKSLRPGLLVHVDGVSSPGEYAPCMTLSDLEVLGQGTIPPPKPVSYGDLASGFEDGQWVEIQGIVHSAVIGPVWTDFSNAYLVIHLSVGGDDLMVRVMNFAGVDADSLPDAEVRVSGVLVPMFTTRHQLFDVVILTPSLSELKVEVPQPANSFQAPTVPINSLLQFSPTRRLGHRVKVAGTVLLGRSGQFFIKDQTQALRVFTEQAMSLGPGDQVEVVGFPAHGQYTPILKDAVFYKTGHGLPPAPTPVSVEEASNGNHNDDFVQMDALLLNTFRYGGEEILVLQQSNFVFNVRLPDNEQTRKLELLARDSLLRVRGICEIQLDNWQQTFQLLCQSPEDVAVLRPPVWWNLPHALGLLAIVTICFAAVLGIVVGRSRQRINEHLRARQQAEAQFAAVNRERNRLAGELHDSLEQALIGIGLQLEAGLKAFLSTPKAVIEHLELARQMVDQSQDEVRRSVWDLRSQMLDNNDLPSALDAIGKYLSHGTNVRVTVEILGAKRRLPDGVENHLLRIGQEAVTNAIKHGQPRHVGVQLAFDSGSVALTVRDDGRGFDTLKRPVSEPGHFGLAGMRERAKALGGTIEVESKAGHGTTITVEVPVAGKFERLQPASSLDGI